MDQPAFGETVQIGRVLSRAFEAIGRNPAIFLGLGVLLAGIPQAVTGILLGVDPFNPDPLAAASWGFALLNLVSLAGWAVLQASVIRVTAIELSGGKASVGQALETGLRTLLPVIGIFLLTGIGAVLGLIALVIPGLVLMAMWAVAVPAYVEERAGVLSSIGRSRALTKGARWKVLGLLMIFVVIALLFQLLAVLVAGLGATASAIVTLLTSGVSSAIYAAIIAALYIELRQVKDGTGAEELARIFA